MSRSILHVDMDAFFVSVELLERPDLRGKPVVVGGTGRRGVVAAASYEARSFGVFSAMPSVRAQRLCPHATFLPGDHQKYGAVSSRIMKMFRDVTPLVEPISLDEAFLDVTGVQRLHGDAVTIARRVRATVWHREKLTCSVGVAPNKFLAKLASEQAKPQIAESGPQYGDGVFVVAPGEELAFLHPLPVRALWGVGAKTADRLSGLGVATIGDLAATPIETLITTLGKASGTHLHALASGVDDRPVDAARATKSISVEETFSYDIEDESVLDVELVRQSDSVAHRLRTANLTARTATLKLRFADFSTLTRRVSAEQPFDTATELLGHVRSLLASIDLQQGVRLLGVGVAGLRADSGEQLSLMFDTTGSENSSDLVAASRNAKDRVVDEVRSKFGSAAIAPASTAVDGAIRVKRRGEQQWGPNADSDSG